METEAKVRTKIEWHKLEKKLNNLAPVLHALIVIADNLANFPNVIDKSIQSLKTYCIREHFSIAENLQKLADTHKITIKELLVLPIKHMSATRYQDIHIPTYGEYLEWSDIEILNHLNAFRPAGETSNRSPLEAETTHIVKIVEEHIKAVGSSKISLPHFIYASLSDSLLPLVHIENKLAWLQINYYLAFFNHFSHKIEEWKASTSNVLQIQHNILDNFITNKINFEKSVNKLKEKFPDAKNYKGHSDFSDILNFCAWVQNGMADLYQAVKQLNHSHFRNFFGANWDNFYEQNSELCRNFLTLTENLQIFTAKYHGPIEAIHNFHLNEFQTTDPFWLGDKFINSRNKSAHIKTGLPKEKDLQNHFGHLKDFVHDATMTMKALLVDTHDQEAPSPLANFLENISNFNSKHAVTFIEKHHEKISPLLGLLFLTAIYQKIDSGYYYTKSDDNDKETKNPLTPTQRRASTVSSPFTITTLCEFTDLKLFATVNQLPSLSHKPVPPRADFKKLLDFLEHTYQFEEEVAVHSEWRLLKPLVETLAIITSNIFYIYSMIYFGIKHCAALITKHLSSTTDILSDSLAAIQQIAKKHEIPFEVTYTSSKEFKNKLVAEASKIKTTLSPKYKEDIQVLDKINTQLASYRDYVNEFNEEVERFNICYSMLSDILGFSMEDIASVQTQALIAIMQPGLNNPFVDNLPEINKKLALCKSAIATMNVQLPDLYTSSIYYIIIPPFFKTFLPDFFQQLSQFCSGYSIEGEPTATKLFTDFFSPLPFRFSPLIAFDSPFAQPKPVAQLYSLDKIQAQYQFTVVLNFAQRFEFSFSSKKEIEKLNVAHQNLANTLKSSLTDEDTEIELLKAEENSPILSGAIVKCTEKNKLISKTKVLQKLLSKYQIKSKPQNEFYVSILSVEHLKEKKQEARRLSSSLTSIILKDFSDDIMGKSSISFTEKGQLNVSFKVENEKIGEEIVPQLYTLLNLKPQNNETKSLK